VVELAARFEPHSGNEAYPYFSKRILESRGENGVVVGRAGSGNEVTTATLRLGDNASWTGSRHDRITLSPNAPADYRIHVTTASLHRNAPKPPLAAATAHVPLLAREGKRELDLYPGAEVYIHGRDLVEAMSMEFGWDFLLTGLREWPQARLEEIEAWPLGFRYKLPADGWPSLDNVPVAVFDAEVYHTAIRLTHPALKGARRLAVRFGTCPDGARVVVMGSDGRVLACEDTFMTESVVPAMFTLIELGEPNPDDHIIFVALDHAPGSSGVRIAIEGVDILETDWAPGAITPAR